LLRLLLQQREAVSQASSEILNLIHSIQAPFASEQMRLDEIEFFSGSAAKQIALKDVFRWVF
jgi:hypothetical protein